MKKVTSLFQKIGGSIAIFVFALMAVYALGMATPSACCKYYESQKLFYREIMPYNNAILILAIVGLLLASLYYVLRNNVRVVYYVSNFVWDGVFVGYSVLSSIITFVGVSFYQGKYSALPFAEMNAYWAERSTTTINPNTSVFLLGYLLGAVILLATVPTILVLVDKIRGRISYERNKRDGIANPVSYERKGAK